MATADAPDRVSSSAIRTALRDGDVRHARAMLGRPHRIVGDVVAGRQRGREIGFPTANLSPTVQLTPGIGVYAALAQQPSGAVHPAAVNVGPQPTFEQENLLVEAHLLDFSGELVGSRLGLHFLRRLRGQVRFDGVDALREQLARDAAAARGEAAAIEAVDAAGLIPLDPLAS